MESINDLVNKEATNNIVDPIQSQTKNLAGLHKVRYPCRMWKKAGLIIFGLGVLLALGFLILTLVTQDKTSGEKGVIALLKPAEDREGTESNPFARLTSSVTEKVEEIKEEGLFGDVINILVIGTDTSTVRRNKGQLGFNTDTMILVSANIETNRILLTSVPRDLWINGNKINSLHTIYGYDVLEDAFEKITGQEVDGYIRVDFDGFSWLVDAFGGVPINVERTFTDNTYPNNLDSDIMSISFTAGEEIMTGERALVFARSRKGNNGEGSDLMRAKRQHLLLQGMVEGISQPESQFWPMDVQNFYTAVTQHMETSLSISDVYYLWDFYKDRTEYEVESFVVDGEYVYHPGMYPASDYHAWVFLPREPGFAELHADVTAKLEGTFISEEELQLQREEAAKKEAEAVAEEKITEKIPETPLQQTSDTSQETEE
jgi:LCP family protein required for cell wall assembly